MGIISVLYTQQTLGTLYKNLENEKASDDSCQIVKDLFDMSQKSLDQLGRTGAFHHMIRRKCASSDSGLNNLKDIQAKTLYLPLTEDGVFGKGLEKQLEKRKEQKEQLNDLLPEFTTNSNIYKNKRKLDYDSRENWPSKNTKFSINSNVNQSNNNRNNYKQSISKNIPRNNTPKKQDGKSSWSKDNDKKDKTGKNIGQRNWGSFRIPRKQNS